MIIFVTCVIGSVGITQATV